ncbi:HAD family hydrolase [Thermobifida halotolerans]|uniref:HAD family hydrolase n=1 Tax=Thermobifida halotolerans TaxID=483545 RepID=UPI0026C2E26A
MTGGSRRAIPLDRISAVVFDMDGVITDTAPVHAAAWKRTFDEFLIDLSRGGGPRFRPFDLNGDYRRHVEGRTRADGVRGFLASRGIALPGTAPPDRPEVITVSALGDRKDRYFMDYVDRYGATAYPSTVELVHGLRGRGVGTAAVSTSRNCAAVLRAARVCDLFDVRVDGVDAVRMGLPGKPHPALFLEAARRLDVSPADAAVVEDSPAGVEAGRRGGFALVVGVDRAHRRADLRARGAHVVVADLSGLELTEAEVSS